jgi:hypothetical protein
MELDPGIDPNAGANEINFKIIQPRGRLGDDTAENLTAVCVLCHQKVTDNGKTLSGTSDPLTRRTHLFSTNSVTTRSREHPAAGCYDVAAIYHPPMARIRQESGPACIASS